MEDRTDSDHFWLAGYMHKYKEIILAYRGTDRASNWATNLDAMRVTYKGDGCSDCGVHEGFQKFYLNTKESAMKAIWEIY